MVVKSVYLGDKGITSTSANFLANMAKETIREYESRLRYLQFYNTSVELINGEKKELKKSTIELDYIETLLKRISNMYAFCAWVREAIKEKDVLLERAQKYDIYQYSKDFGIESVPERPDDPKMVTEQDIINEMSIKERNRYLMIETFAATFGKYIHPDGSIAEAREAFHEKIASPTTVRGDGRDLLIYTYTPAFKLDDVENTFVSLQTIQRKYEKELNALKFRIKEEVNKRNTQLQSEFQAAYNEYRTQSAIIYAECEKQRIALMDEISKLRIVIPNELEDTYNYLQALTDKS